MPIDPNLDPLQAKPLTPSESQARRAFAARNNRHDFNNADLSNIEMPSHWAVPWADLMMVMMVMFAVMLATNLAERDVSELFKKDIHPPKSETKSQPKQHVQPPPPKSTITQSEPQDDLRSKEKTPTEPNPVNQAQEQTAQSTPVNPPTKAAEKIDAGAIPIEDILRLSKNLVTEANLDDIDVVLTDNQSIKVSVRGNLLFDLGKADLKSEAISFLRTIPVALTSTLYGILVAYFVCIPIAENIHARTQEELLVHKLIAEGVSLIGQEYNTMCLQTRLQSFITPHERDIKNMSIKEIRDKYEELKNSRMQ